MMTPLLRKSKTMQCLLNRLSPLPMAMTSHYPPSYRDDDGCKKSSHLFGIRSSIITKLLGSSSRTGFREYCSNSATRVTAIGSVKFVEPDSLSYLNHQQAVNMDEILTGPLGFSADQLVEVAGHSVASSVAEVYRPLQCNRVLVICGPGNNGGNGLVAARYLHHFGYNPVVCCPEHSDAHLHNRLIMQLTALEIPFLSVGDLPVDLSTSYDIILDAMCGLSFQGSPRPPFDGLIQNLVALGNLNQKQEKLPAIVSVDIPSGWHVEEGDISGRGIKPDMLVSVTAPKMCAKKFSGRHHFLCCRYLSPSMAEKFHLELPAYPGTFMCIRIGKPPRVDISTLRENYISPEFTEDQAEADPFIQFQKWFDDAMASGLKESNAMALSTAGKSGKPSSRMVLLKGMDKDGFVWYTNYGSPKAHQLSENPCASLLFYWGALFRQVKIEGSVQRISDEESEQYFHTRPKASQIGAIVSNQSTVISGRHFLEQRQKELEAQYSDGSMIPKPKYWGGYRLKPELFEFWQGQPSNLHDRLCYSRQEIDGKSEWKLHRLAP